MKKFLTVLLVIAVMFTFSFSAAFAAVPVPGEPTATTRNEAIAEAQKELISDLEAEAKAEIAALAAQYQETAIDTDCVIDGSVYADTIKKIVADYTAVINTAAKMVKADTTITDNYATAIANTEVAAYEYAGSEVKVKYADIIGADLGDMATATTGYYAVYTWANALDAMKTYVNGELAKIDMSLYTNDVIDASAAYPQTWAEKAAEIKGELADIVADTEVDMTKDSAANLTALQAMYAVLDELEVEDSYKDIYNKEYITAYRFAAKYGLKTAEDLADDNTMDEVTKATLKAALASEVANQKMQALEDYKAGGSKADYDAALKATAAFEEVNALLIEEGKKEDTSWVTADVAADRIALYEAAAKDAEIVKIQVEKDGSAKYDAAKVDEILAKAKVAIYAGEATKADFSGALVGEDMFAWNKEVKLAQAKANLEDALAADDYYDPEVAKIEAAYQKVIDKIEAAANQKQLDTCAVTADVSAIDTQDDVKGKLEGYANTAKFVEAVNKYIELFNMQSGAKSYEDAYIADVEAADVVDYLAEQGARTNNDVAGLLGQAEAFAKTVETNGAKAAEAEALEKEANDLIKALPTVITLADKEAVANAYEAAKKAGVTSGKLAAAVGAVQKAEEDAIAAMFKALPAKITTADKAAVEAIEEAIDAYKATGMYPQKADYARQLKEAKDALRAAELAAVHAAINAIDPADEATVEAARAAVDAYVAEYTDAAANDRAIDDIQNLDKLTYAEAQVVLAKIEAVEGLKITASSSAKKGSITVKWTVKGDTSAVEGYEVWKSTKHSAGYKKAFTTTKKSYKNTKGLKKGTRYYYKVRAFAYVNGEKITSDWSNKARRIAK